MLMIPAKLGRVKQRPVNVFNGMGSPVEPAGELRPEVSRFGGGWPTREASQVTVFETDLGSGAHQSNPSWTRKQRGLTVSTCVSAV